jgi:acetoin utilization deacetylase AcuC-like enzyme
MGVTAVINNFKKKNNNNLIGQEPKKFDQYLLIKTHSKEYIEFVNNSFPKDGLSFLDSDTIISPGSKDATRDAAE